MEKRKYKRLALKVTMQLETLNGEEISSGEELEIEVTDISSGGIGFDSAKQLDVMGYYNTKLEIWTKEEIPCVIEILREEENGEGLPYHYGGVFIGMNDIDKRKIYIYQLIDELETERAGKQ